MKITQLKFYGAAREKVCRLGLADLFLELQQVVFDAVINLLEAPNANGITAIRRSLDEQFKSRADWKKRPFSGVDWVKTIGYQSKFIARLGVKIQASSRRGLVIRDIVRLRAKLRDGDIDVGVDRCTEQSNASIPKGPYSKLEGCLSLHRDRVSRGNHGPDCCSGYRG